MSLYRYYGIVGREFEIFCQGGFFVLGGHISIRVRVVLNRSSEANSILAR